MENKLLTIRECAKTGIAKENFIRELVRKGKCPGIRRGNRFYVNLNLLQEQLNNYSMEEVRNEHANE